MGTIGDKLAYLDGTKQAIKQALINKNIEVTDEDTFRSYAEKLDNLAMLNAQFKEGFLSAKNGTELRNLVHYNIQKLPKITLNSKFTANLFYDLQGLLEVPELELLVTILDSSAMFYNCKCITEAPLFDTSSVTNFANMFQNCYALTTAPAYNTSNGTNVSYMFFSCTHLTEVPAYDLRKATTIQAMFKDCQTLTTAPAITTSNALTTTQE